MTPTILEAVLKNRSNVGTDEQVRQLKDEIMHYCTTQPSASFSNQGCWRGVQQLESIDFLLKNIEEMFKESIEYYASKDQLFSNFKNLDFQIHYWSNVNPPRSRNVLHSHKPGILSGVYYIQGQGTGALRIINPANLQGECNPQSPFTRDFFFNPKDKDLIMWPSWLPHEVEPNNTEKARINIAYDVRFINEN